jgi:elongation factor P hydroxylase
MQNCNSDGPGNLSDLIALQVRFGLSYVQEARSAQAQGRVDYAELAGQMARNALATAARFAARAPNGREALTKDVAQLEEEVKALSTEPVAVRSIA